MVGYGNQTRLSTLLPIRFLDDCPKRVFAFWWLIAWQYSFRGCLGLWFSLLVPGAGGRWCQPCFKRERFDAVRFSRDVVVFNLAF